MNTRYPVFLRGVLKLYPVTFPKLFGKPGNSQYIARMDLIVVRRVFKDKRKNSEIDQVLPVNSREVLGNHDPEAKIARSQCCVFVA
jgi:hypothetical protein